MVTLLTRLYEGTCVSKELDAYLLGLMEKQNDRQLLGALLPKKLRLAQVSTSEAASKMQGHHLCQGKIHPCHHDG